MSSAQGEDDFDPHQHRSVKKPTNYFETLAHMIKCCFGTGILAMPQGFLQAGYIVGFAGTFILGLITTYCIHILISSQYVLCKKRRVGLLTYPESMRVAVEEGPKCFSKHGNLAYYATDFFIVGYITGALCIYILFIAENIKQVLDQHMNEVSLLIHMAILMLPLYLMLNVRDLKLLAPFSTFANIVTMLSLGIIIYYVAFDTKELSKLKTYGELKDFPLFVGTVIFAIVSIGVIVTLENNMEDPRLFGTPLGVLNVGMVIVVTMYAILGLVGYIKYGEDCAGSITLNLPMDETLSKICKILMAIAIFISYGLQAYVPISILWERYIQPKTSGNHDELWQQSIRICIILFSFCLAACIPHLGLFISLVGSLFLSALGIIFPGFIEICARYPDKFGRFYFHLHKDILIILFGIFVLVSGTTIAISDIIASFM